MMIHLWWSTTSQVFYLKAKYSAGMWKSLALAPTLDEIELATQLYQQNVAAIGLIPS